MIYCSVTAMLACAFFAVMSILGPAGLAGHSLSDNAKNATLGQLGALFSFLGAAGIAHFLSSPESYASIFGFHGLAEKLTDAPFTPFGGPGILEAGEYFAHIAGAGSQEAANQAAATGIYGILLAGGAMGDTMNPMVNSVITMGSGQPSGGHGGGGVQGGGDDDVPHRRGRQ